MGYISIVHLHLFWSCLQFCLVYFSSFLEAENTAVLILSITFDNNLCFSNCAHYYHQPTHANAGFSVLLLLKVFLHTAASLYFFSLFFFYFICVLTFFKAHLEFQQGHVWAKLIDVETKRTRLRDTFVLHTDNLTNWHCDAVPQRALQSIIYHFTYFGLISVAGTVDVERRERDEGVSGI